MHLCFSISCISSITVLTKNTVSQLASVKVMDGLLVHSGLVLYCSLDNKDCESLQ